ncbi:response regulator transcription factor [Lentibacillus cibarius]|uniref:Response regulator transcription factor n=1 Tax=Lentibacillus cibarius TaxID=2583219 RepID=A0A549YIR1_9BACI|nr:response regulator transcription factor [Lentibacillus cibarius]
MFTIMLIEDDETLSQEVKERLSQWSYNVVGVVDFGNVFEEFTVSKPDLVIIDIQLPK